MQVLILLGAEAAVVILEVLMPGKALGAACTAEFVVTRVGALVLGKVCAAAEGLAAQATLVELHAWEARGGRERYPDPSPCNSASAHGIKPSLWLGDTARSCMRKGPGEKEGQASVGCGPCSL